MLFHVYLRNSIAFVPTVVRLQTGALMDTKPVAVVPVANNEDLRRAFLNVIAKGNRVVLNPPKDNWPEPILPKLAGVKSWSAFASRASLWSIEATNGNYRIGSYRKHRRGYWKEDRDQTIQFPPEATVDDAVDRMIAILQKAARKDAGK